MEYFVYFYALLKKIKLSLECSQFVNSSATNVSRW